MQWSIQPIRGRTLRAAAALLASAALVAAFRRPLGQVAGLVAGAALTAFLAEPLSKVLEKKLSRSASAVVATAGLVAAVGALMVLLLPAMLRDMVQLAQALPRSLRGVSQWYEGFSIWLELRLPGLTLPEINLDSLAQALPGLATGTFALAGSAADWLSRLSLAVMLGCFFLGDRDAMLLRLELAIPQRARRTAVRMGNAVLRELRLYLRGQLMIACAVAALSAAGLALVRVRSALVLGASIGILNMIPYFGPFIGGVPAVLIALGDGWQRAAMAAGVLVLVQQMDSAVISPRIMGSLTGFSPATVLIAIFAGAKLFGLVGMLIALPVIMSIRTVFRVFVQSHENI